MTESEASLWDAPLQAEIILLGELISAATIADSPLDESAIDQALGLK
ncbi:MAG: hypothetical protein ACRC0L_01455 [Angustibacter sp.]